MGRRFWGLVMGSASGVSLCSREMSRSWQYWAKKRRDCRLGDLSLFLSAPRSPTEPISTHFIRAEFISNIDHQGMHLVSPNIRLCFFSLPRCAAMRVNLHKHIHAETLYGRANGTQKSLYWPENTTGEKDAGSIRALAARTNPGQYSRTLW